MREICRLRPTSSGHDFEPFGKCPFARLVESLARDQVALQIEMVVNGVMDGKKTLH